MSDMTLAYVLHSRPYQDTHLIVDLLTERVGRQSVMVRYAKANHAKSRIWQAFNLLELAWRGRSELPLVTEAEILNSSHALSGTALFCGFYMNELLQKLWPKGDASTLIWSLYQQTLSLLTEPHLLEPGLRRFEYLLLQELGVGIDFYADAQAMPIISAQYYHYQPGRGWQISIETERSILGADLQLLSQLLTQDSSWSERVACIPSSVWLSAKRLSRQMLALLLEGRELKSRQLFMA